MKQLIFKFGLYAGIFIGVTMAISFSLGKNNPHTGTYGMFIGYSIMILAFITSMLFACKQYTNQLGEFKLGKCILLCLGIAGITSIIYVISWALIYHFIVPDFINQYLDGLKKQLASGKLSKEKFDEYAKMMDNYHNPIYFTAMTLMEILPPGILIALILPSVQSLFRRKKA